MRLFLVPIVLCLLAYPALAQEAGSRLNLVCMGAGSANKATSTYAYGGNKSGDTAWANVIGNRVVPFDDQVNLWIEGDGGEVRMPPTMLPPVHGGNGGWFKLSSVKVSDTEITGAVNVNFMNKPKLRLDRLTGSISLAGKAGDYSGRCSKYDPASTKRAF